MEMATTATATLMGGCQVSPFDVLCLQDCRGPSHHQLCSVCLHAPGSSTAGAATSTYTLCAAGCLNQSSTLEFASERDAQWLLRSRPLRCSCRCCQPCACSPTQSNDAQWLLCSRPGVGPQPYCIASLCRTYAGGQQRSVQPQNHKRHTCLSAVNSIMGSNNRRQLCKPCAHNLASSAAGARWSIGSQPSILQPFVTPKFISADHRCVYLLCSSPSRQAAASGHLVWPRASSSLACPTWATTTWAGKAIWSSRALAVAQGMPAPSSSSSSQCCPLAHSTSHPCSSRVSSRASHQCRRRTATG